MFAAMADNDKPQLIVEDFSLAPDGMHLRSIAGDDYVIPYSAGLQVKPFKIARDGDGTYQIKDVPIFRCHVARHKINGELKEIVVDEQYIDDMIANFKQLKDQHGWLPKVFPGHTEDGKPPTAVAAYTDNLQRRGDTLYCDYRFMSREWHDRIVSGQFPDRSVEVALLSRRLNGVALLGDEEPYFKLPQMRPGTFDAASVVQQYRRNPEEDYIVVRYSEMKDAKKAARLSYAMAVRSFVNVLDANAKFEATDEEIERFAAESCGGDMDGLLGVVKKAMGAAAEASKKEKMNNPNDKSGHGYSLTVSDLAKYINQGGDGTSGNATRSGMLSIDAPPNFTVDSDGKVPNRPDTNHFTARDETIAKYETAVTNLSERVQYLSARLEKSDRDAEAARYQARLVSMAQEGVLGLNATTIPDHLATLAALPNEDERAKYMARLEKAPKIRPETRERIPVSSSTPGSKGKYNMEESVARFKAKAENDPKLRSELHKMGVKDVGAYALARAWADGLADNFGEPVVTEDDD